MKTLIYCTPLDLICQPLEWWSSAAAWAQALLSVLAIMAAARLATRQERLAVRRKADACVGLITHAQDMLSSIIVAPLSETAIVRVRTVAQQLQEVSLESAPDFNLVLAVREASSAVSVLLIELESARTDIHIPNNMKHTIARDHVKQANKHLADAYEMAADAANALSTPTLLQRFRYWRFKAGKKS